MPAKHAGKLLYVSEIGCWFYWDRKRWKQDNVGYAKRAVLEVLGDALKESLTDQNLRKDVAKCETAAGIAGVLAIASALDEFAATTDDLDADPYLLNIDNGTLDLRTMELRDHDPRDHITKITRGAYWPGEDTIGPSWSTFLNRVLPDGQVCGYLQRATGLALLGKVTEHILPILKGTGANGKGTWYGAVLHALGDYAAPAEPELFMDREGGHPTGQMDLIGRRMVVVSESDKGRRMNEANMKRLVGGDKIKARWMRRDFIEFTPSHTAFLVTNHLPKVSGDDPAVWRRLRVIPFDVVIPPEEYDRQLDEKLQLEADAVLAWAIAGWQDYRQHSLAEPPQVLVATEEYQKDSDAVGRFIDEECVTTSPALSATTKKLFNAWELWRLREGADPLSQKAFGQTIDEKGFPVTSRTSTERRRGGIDLKPIIE